MADATLTYAEVKQVEFTCNQLHLLLDGNDVLKTHDSGNGKLRHGKDVFQLLLTSNSLDIKASHAVVFIDLESFRSVTETLFSQKYLHQDCHPMPPKSLTFHDFSVVLSSGGSLAFYIDILQIQESLITIHNGKFFVSEHEAQCTLECAKGQSILDVSTVGSMILIFISMITLENGNGTIRVSRFYKDYDHRASRNLESFDAAKFYSGQDESASDNDG